MLRGRFCFRRGLRAGEFYGGLELTNRIYGWGPVIERNLVFWHLSFRWKVLASFSEIGFTHRGNSSGAFDSENSFFFPR